MPPEAGAPFAGRVALVTGGSGGIGRPLVLGLAAAGAAVGVGYGASREPAEELAAEVTAGGGRAVAIGADLGERAAAAQLVGVIEHALGPVDLLVANHGLARRQNWDEVGPDDWDDTLSVNLRAPFLLAQRVLPGMRARGWGRVLFVSSGAAFTGGIVGPHYAASKAGLHGLTHFLAARVAADGVTVNAIAPALVEDTGMLPGKPEELTAHVPVARLGRPEEVADLALAMLRNGYLTSQVVGLDGGMHPR
jgi:3-oxoacyl-[acyl-carrier protein] reductase